MQKEDKIEELGIELIKLISGKDKSDKPFYAYVRIFSEKLEEFTNLDNSYDLKSINVSEYGEIIKSGWGKTPSEEVKEYMKENHNCLEEFEEIFEAEFSENIKKTEDRLKIIEEG